MARVLVLDVVEGFHIAQCVELKDFYRELKANPFDIVVKNIGGKDFDVFVDDEGLLKDKPVVSAVNKDMCPELVGNLIFANRDSKGRTTDLSDDDMMRILKNTVMTVDEKPRIIVVCERR